MLSSSEAAVTLQFVRYQPQQRATFRLTNGSRQTLVWSGYPGTPWYRFRQRDLFGWHEREVGWFCGVGFDTHQLRPAASIKFGVDLPERDSHSLQVGIDYTAPAGKQTLTVWSPPFSPRQ